MYAGYYYGIENNCVVEHMAVYDYFVVILYAWIHFIVIGLLLFFFLIMLAIFINMQDAHS